MKTPTVVLGLALLVGCRGETEQAPEPAPPPAEAESGAPAPMLESTPAQGTTQFVPGLELERQKARNRASAFDEVVGR